MPSSKDVVTNFRDSNNVDLGKKLVTKEYFLDAYPAISQQLGISPELWIWGENLYGRLGNNTTATNSLTPITTFAGGSNWKQVHLGYRRAAGIKTDGTLWAWGRNQNYEHGINDLINRSTPVTTFAGGNNWKQVHCGKFHTAAIKTDGTLWVWGNSGAGQLGNNGTGDRAVPRTTFAGGNDWKQVSTGEAHCAAIKTDGTLWLWGSNGRGQLGINRNTGNINDRVSTPVTTFAGENNWKQVSCGNSFTTAIKTDGTLWVWGRNYNAQLGTNDESFVSNNDRYTPVTTFAGGNNWKQVSAGLFHTAAIKTDGTLWCWGSTANGQRGDNTSAASYTPLTTFAGGNNWKYVGCGQETTTAIKTDGSLWIWGYNFNGALGINNTTTERIFTPVTTFAGGNDWKVSIGGSYFNAGLKSINF